MAITYRVKIGRNDLQLEVDGDRKFVLEMLNRFDPPGTTSTAAGKREQIRQGKEGNSKAAVLSPAAGKAISPGEFIRQFQFKKHTDLALAFGYYLEKHSGVDAFSSADINNCYYEAKMESSNTSQMIILNIRRGFMMKAKGKGDEKKSLFTLTATGEKHVKESAAVEE